MPPWLVMAIVVIVAVVPLALVWWRSGRARTGRIDRDLRSPHQRMELDVNQLRTMRNRDGLGPRP